MADEARGGAFGGTTDIDQPIPTPTQGQTDDLSRGGFFTSDNQAISDQPSAPQTDGNTDKESRGGFFTTDNQVTLEEAQQFVAGLTEDEARGGFFGGFTDTGLQITQGPVGPRGPMGLAGRGIESISSAKVGNIVTLTITYTDGQGTQNVDVDTAPIGLLRSFSDALDSQAVAPTLLSIRKPTSTTIEIAPSPTGGTPGTPTVTRTLIINFGATTTSTLDGVSVPVVANAGDDSVRIVSGGTIRAGARVEVNGVNFLPGTDFLISNGTVTFQDFQIELNSGDVIIITYTENV